MFLQNNHPLYSGFLCVLHVVYMWLSTVVYSVLMTGALQDNESREPVLCR